MSHFWDVITRVPRIQPQCPAAPWQAVADCCLRPTLTLYPTVPGWRFAVVATDFQCCWHSDPPCLIPLKSWSCFPSSVLLKLAPAFLQTVVLQILSRQVHLRTHPFLPFLAGERNSLAANFF